MEEKLLDARGLKERIKSLVEPLLEKYLDALLIVSEEGFPFYEIGDVSADDLLAASFASAFVSNMESLAAKKYLRDMTYILQKSFLMRTILAQYTFSMNRTSYVALFLRGFLILVKAKRNVSIHQVSGIMIRHAARILRILEGFAKPVTLIPPLKKPVIKVTKEVDAFSAYMDILNEVLELRKKLIGAITWEQLYEEIQKLRKLISEWGEKLRITNNEKFKRVMNWMNQNLERIQNYISRTPQTEVPENAKEILRTGLMNALFAIKEAFGISA